MGFKILSVTWSSVRFAEVPSVSVLLAGPVVGIIFGWFLTRIGRRFKCCLWAPYLVYTGYTIIVFNIVVNLNPWLSDSDGTKIFSQIMLSL